ncbi:MAG: hypothetical protein ACE5JF_11825 [Anaerolineales bacterium]
MVDNRLETQQLRRSQLVASHQFPGVEVNGTDDSPERSENLNLMEALGDNAGAGF